MTNVSIRATYTLTKKLIERDAMALKKRVPSMHLADACTEVLRRNPAYWRVYKAAMAPQVAMPSEFQRGKRKRAIPTPKDCAWQIIEDLGRTLVAASREPLTLRNAVGLVVRFNPALYERYSNAHRRQRKRRRRR
jgi:hypothetical protein